MPKRATLTFSSEDAPNLAEEKLHVYYCLYSGKHAFTLDCDLNTLPRRQKDGAHIVDTIKHVARFYTVEGPKKVIRRKDGSIERQYRMHVGKLPVAYRSDPSDHVVFVIPDSVSSLSQQAKAQQAVGGSKAPVPPCIAPLPVDELGSEVRLEVEDNAAKPALIKVTADGVRVQISGSISTTKADEELLDFMGKVLGTRLTHITLKRGHSTRHKLMIVRGLAPQQIYDKILAAIEGGMGFTAAIPPSGTERGGWRGNLL